MKNREPRYLLPAAIVVLAAGFLACDGVAEQVDCQVGHIVLSPDQQQELASRRPDRVTSVRDALTDSGAIEPQRVTVTLNSQQSSATYNEMTFQVSVAAAQLADLPFGINGYMPVEEEFSDRIAPGDILLQSDRC